MRVCASCVECKGRMVEALFSLPMLRPSAQGQRLPTTSCVKGILVELAEQTVSWEDTGPRNDFYGCVREGCSHTNRHHELSRRHIAAGAEVHRRSAHSNIDCCGCIAVKETTSRYHGICLGRSPGHSIIPLTLAELTPCWQAPNTVLSALSFARTAHDS